VELTVIGAGPAYSDRPGALGACYLVREADAAIVLDLGHGTFSGLARRVEPSRLLAVTISHLHADHFIDLVPLRHYLRWSFDPPRRVTVLGPAELGGRLDALHADPRFSDAALDLVLLVEATRSVGPFTIEARRVRHTDDSYAVRVAAGSGPGLVYSGDCGEAGDLEPLIRPGDVLLVEASFGAGPAVPGAGHLDGPAIAGLAGRTQPGRVLITHVLPDRDPAAAADVVRAGFAGIVDVVEPGFTAHI
jgi:ribonuclease BN (tRNA processing enzyme)